MILTLTEHWVYYRPDFDSPGREMESELDMGKKGQSRAARRCEGVKEHAKHCGNDDIGLGR